MQRRANYIKKTWDLFEHDPLLLWNQNLRRHLIWGVLDHGA